MSTNHLTDDLDLDFDDDRHDDDNFVSPDGGLTACKITISVALRRAAEGCPLAAKLLEVILEDAADPVTTTAIMLAVDEWEGGDNRCLRMLKAASSPSGE